MRSIMLISSIKVTQKYVLQEVFAIDFQFFVSPMSSLVIQENLLNIWDDHHLDSLYKACRLCYTRQSSKDKETFATTRY